MSAANPRIAILGMHLESNAFAPVSTEQDFRKSCYFEGDAMLAEAAKPAPKPSKSTSPESQTKQEGALASMLRRWLGSS